MSKTAIPPDDLLAMAVRLEGWQREMPAFDYRNRQPYDRAVARLVQQIADLPAPARGKLAHEGAVGWRLRLLGLSASCTSSATGACHNWIVNARKRAAKGGG